MKEYGNPVKGMNKDIHFLNQEGNTYTYALNAIMESSTGEGFLLQNDYSNILGTILTEDENVVGDKYINAIETAILFTNKNRILGLKMLILNDQQLNVYSYEEGSNPIDINNTQLLQVTVLAQSDCFNWNLQHKVDIEYKITDSTINLYFTDKGYNEDRYIYFNKDLTVNESFKQVTGQYNNELIYSNEIDCDKIKWYPQVTYPDIELDDIEGGNLIAGAYQFSVAFATSKGVSLTPYKQATNPFNLFTKTLTDVTNYNTGKAITVNLQGLDITGRYTYINIAVTKTINGITTHDLITTLPLSPTINYIYTGGNKHIPLDELTLFQTYPFYRSSNGLTKANNKLFKYGVRDFEKYNLQSVINNLSLKWFTITAQEGDYGKPEFAQNYRTYTRDEVYMFGIKFILDNGEETQVYLLSNREADLNDKEIVDNLDAVHGDEDCTIDKPKEKWKVYNTGKVTSSSLAQLNVCDYKQYQEGDFAYWESSEKLPSDSKVWGDLSDTPIRGFKFPDCLVSPHHNGTSKNKVDSNFIYPLGVKLSDESSIDFQLQYAVDQGLISQAQKDRIKGYKIIRGNRVGNKSIIAKGMLTNIGAYNEKGKSIFYQNYGFNDLRDDPFISAEDLKHLSVDDRKAYRAGYGSQDRFTFHSPDTSFTQPSLGGILKIEADLSGTSRGFFSESRKQAEYVLLSQLHYNFAIVIAWLLTSRLKLSESADPGSQGSAIGSGVGAVIGGVVGAAAGGVGAVVGAPIGSALGGVIGRLVGGMTSNDDYNDMYRLSMWISQTDRILELLQNTIPMQNYHWQYQAVGKYTNADQVDNDGFKQRKIKHVSYVDQTRQIVANDLKFNNNNRESTVYVELEGVLNPSKTIDNSKFTSQKPDGTCWDENEEILSNISGLYASIKRDVVNQYGTVYDIEWIPTSNKMWKIGEQFKEFGGDQFIGREYHVKKHSFFTNTAYNLPDRTDIYYEDYSNIGYPIYFFNTRFTETTETKEFTLKLLEGVTNAMPVLAALNNIESPRVVTEDGDGVGKYENHGVQVALARIFRNTMLTPYNTTRPGRYYLDCLHDNFVYKYPNNNGDLANLVEIDVKEKWWKDKTSQYINNMRFTFEGISGKIYTYYYAIPGFICESDVNLDLRHAENPNEKDFYPRQTDLNYWLQEENVSPKVDNFYGYNRSYSKQNHEDISIKTDANFIKDIDKIYYENRAVYSQDGAEVEGSDYKDPYLYFKPLDARDLSFENGKLISMDSIESGKILLRFEDNTRVMNAYTTVRADVTTLALGNGSLFDNIQDFSKTDLGYIGSQHTAMLNTEFGHIIVDCKRGNVFNINPGASGVDELTKDGMRNWMIENLPFQINRYYPEIDIDNNYNGVGLALCYDKRYKRFFITKLDYKPIVQGVIYKENKFWYKDIQVELTDKRFFCQLSFTVSYSFYTKMWTSFHSFTPNYYIDGVNTFYSGINGNGKGLSSLWVHNASNKSFQTYYDTLYPFEIEATGKTVLTSNITTEINYSVDVLRYHNEYDKSSVDNITFNKAIVSNDKQNSGLLELDVIDENDLFATSEYPIKESDRTKISITKNENLYSFNQFKDITRPNNLPRWVNTCNNVNKVLNLNAIDYDDITVNNNYIRGEKCYVRLINDKHSAYKFIFKGLITDGVPSTR